MNSRNTISEELKALESQLSPIHNNNPYQVPQGYFDGLAEKILARLHSDQVSAEEEINTLSPLLAGLSRKMPFEVPSRYFEETAGNLNALTREEEESLVLSFISREMPYQVPTGYFAGLPEQVLQKLSSRKAKVVPIMRSGWMRVAAAAMVAGIIALSGIFYFNQDRSVSTGSDAIAKEVEKASTEELNAFIRSTTGLSTTTEQKSAITEEAKALLDDVSDKELEAFLSNFPTEDLPLADDELDLLYN
jgi:hypothetical protein